LLKSNSTLFSKCLVLKIIISGWETLSTRRKVKKLLLFYKIVNKEAPDHLYELVPPLVAANVNYNLRNSHNIHVIGRMMTKYIFSR
jgi:hypothetical protein